jgi:hypothetical protein
MLALDFHLIPVDSLLLPVLFHTVLKPQSPVKSGTVVTFITL